MCVLATTCWLVELHAISQSVTNILQWAIWFNMSNEILKTSGVVQWVKSSLKPKKTDASNPFRDMAWRRRQDTQAANQENWWNSPQIFPILWGCEMCTPSPSKSLKSRQVQLGVEMSISYNVNIIHLIVTQDSSKKTKKTHLSEQHPPHIGADFGLLSRSFKIFRGLRMLRKISNVSNVAGKRILLVLLQSPWPRRTRWTPTETKRKRALIPNPKALRQLLRQLFSCQESIGKCQTAGPKGNWVLKSSEGSPSTFSVRRDACVVVVVHFV